MERYQSYAQWLKREYGERVQKISINLPFSCPNRDGTKGHGGCIYCDNQSFLPEYTLHIKTIEKQIEEGINYFRQKYPTQRYIAYFQNYTNTYANIEILYSYYKQAIEKDEIVALSISTRPDCLSDEIIELMAEINQTKRVFVEIGIESTHDKTLQLINRCHTFDDVIQSVNKLHNKNLLISGHLIFGLPGESIEDTMIHAQRLSNLPFHSLKLHQLQVLKNTRLYHIYSENPGFIYPLSLTEHINWCISFLEHLSPNIYLERFTSESPKEKVVAPNWNQIKNYQVVELIKKELTRRNTFQGKFFNETKKTQR